MVFGTIYSTMTCYTNILGPDLALSVILSALLHIVRTLL